MAEDKFLGRWRWDHNILHEHGRADRDAFWNLTPMPIKDHAEKTKRDLKIIAKSRRIRKRVQSTTAKEVLAETEPLVTRIGDALSSGFREGMRTAYDRIVAEERAGKRNPLRHWKRTIQSRGFDKTRSRKMSGKVVKRGT